MCLGGSKKIAVLSGDGIGPEVMAEAKWLQTARGQGHIGPHRATGLGSRGKHYIL